VRDAYRVLVGNPRERDHSEDQGIDGRVILKRILKKWEEGVDWIDLAQEQVAGC
jgi:hypothetical protein